MNRPRAFLLLAVFLGPALALSSAEPPNVILMMADDMGWGQTGFRGHPVLKPDAMAAHGLRFERFYAANPVCSPTRASVFTGRTGVFSHGHALRLQERTMAQALRQAGNVSGHFGIWHLDGFRSGRTTGPIANPWHAPTPDLP